MCVEFIEFSTIIRDWHSMSMSVRPRDPGVRDLRHGWKTERGKKGNMYNKHIINDDLISRVIWRNSTHKNGWKIGKQRKGILLPTTWQTDKRENYCQRKIKRIFNCSLFKFEYQMDENTHFKRFWKSNKYRFLVCECECEC